MKYVLTGSIGNITKPVAEKLIKEKHEVSIISSNAANAAVIQQMGARALIGNIEDLNFLTTAFKGADAVYLMIPPKWDVTDWLPYQQKISDNYVAAVKQNNIQHVVVLSSVGAHMGTGCGPVDGLAYLESKIKELGVHAAFLRPSYFYYNLLSMIGLVKNAGIMGSNQPGDFKLVLVHPEEIAVVAAEKLSKLNFENNEITYIASDERTWDDITKVLGNAVNKTNIPWVEFTDEQSLDGMLKAGLPETIAKGYTNMGAALRTGEMEADYFKHKTELGKIKLEDFAKEFAAAFAAG